MRAAMYTRFGGPDVVSVREIERPTPGDDEVLVRVEASTVSAADHRARTSEVPRGMGAMAPFVFGWPRPRHRILGLDLAGTIEQMGSAVTTFTPGDRVFALMPFTFGAHAEYVLCKANGCIAPAPESLSPEEATALVFGGTTTLAYLRQREIRPGDSVLVNGAAGAVGSLAVQIAKARGATVTAVTSQRNREFVTGLGADEVIDYETEDFAAMGRRWDVIVECVGNAQFERVRDCVAEGGALVLIILDLKGMLTHRRNTRRSGFLVVGSAHAPTADDLRELAAMADSGAITPVIDTVFELDDVAEAHRLVDTGHKRGNVVLRIAR